MVLVLPFQHEVPAFLFRGPVCFRATSSEVSGFWTVGKLQASRSMLNKAGQQRASSKMWRLPSQYRPPKVVAVPNTSALPGQLHTARSRDLRYIHKPQWRLGLTLTLPEQSKRGVPGVSLADTPNSLRPQGTSRGSLASPKTNDNWPFSEEVQSMTTVYFSKEVP